MFQYLISSYCQLHALSAPKFPENSPITLSYHVGLREGAFWVLPMSSISKPYPNGNDIIQRELLGTDIL